MGFVHPRGLNSVPPEKIAQGLTPSTCEGALAQKRGLPGANRLKMRHPGRGGVTGALLRGDFGDRERHTAEEAV